ncbi:MAG: ATP-binding protein [Acidobacteria bacterium]|nr:ATP-binding protein [Acidobacteriota bacterium]
MNIRSLLYASRDLEEFRRRLKAMAQVLGCWNAELETAIETAIFHNDEEYLGFISEQLEQGMAANGLEAHPLMPDPDAGEVDRGELFLGQLTTGGNVRLSSADLQKNMLVVAAPGRGKSTLVGNLLRQVLESGQVRVHIFDTTHEYPDILIPLFGPDRLQVLAARDARINPFKGPPTISHEEWVIGLLPRGLRESLFWRDRTVEMYRCVCLKLLEIHGRVTPRSFCATYEKFVPKSRQYFQEFASLERFATLLKTVETFKCTDGEDIDEAACHSRIYMMKDYPDDARLFFVTINALLHFVSRAYERNRKLDLLLVFDELSSFYTRETLAQHTDKSESFYLQLLRNGRKMGLGVTLADQTYSLIHAVARSNCQTKIALDVRDAPSRREIARDLGLNREQEEFLAALSWKQENRRAVVQLHDYPYAVLVNVPVIEKPRAVSVQELQERMQAAAATMPVDTREPSSAKQSAPPARLDDKYEQLLGAVCADPLASFQEHATTMKIAKATFSSYADYLKENGFLHEHSVWTGRSGGQEKILLLTDKGKDYLRDKGIKKFPSVGIGSVDHQYWQRKVWRKVRTDGCLGGVEYMFNGKSTDVGLILPNKKVAYEIVWDPNIDKEVSNLQKDLAAGFDEIIFCVRDEVMRQKLEIEFFKTLPDWKSRASIVLLESFADKGSAQRKKR